MSGVAAETLNDAERAVVEATAIGAWAAFPVAPGEKPRVRAALVRHLLLGEAVPGARETAHAALPGVRIRGAAIDGPLNLADCARPGSGLPTLALEQCDILEPMNLAAARLARLSLAHSRFTFANLRETEIEGPFNLSHAHGFGDGECWIDARGALIIGDVTAAHATLQSPKARPPGTFAADEGRTALWLAGATIRGSVRLLDDFHAIGGVSLDSAVVRGDVVLFSGKVTSGETDAFRAQNANVEGVMILQHFVAEGVVWLFGIRTGGILEISDATIHGNHSLGHGFRHAPRNQPLALIISEAEIGASMYLAPKLVTAGLVSFRLAKIRGEVRLVDANLHNRSTDGRARAVYATHAEIGASLMFDDATVEGRVDIAGARIGGHLSLLRAKLTNRTEDTTGKALEAMNVTIGGNAMFGAYSHSGVDGSPAEGKSGARICGCIDLTGAQIVGELAFTGSYLTHPLIFPGT